METREPTQAEQKIAEILGERKLKTPPITPQHEPETLASVDGKVPYQPFTDCEASDTNHASKEDERDQLAFDFYTPDCVHTISYGTMLECKLYHKRGMLHLILTSGQYVIEGRNLEPIRKALKRRTLLTLTQFDAEQHVLPSGNTTVITAINDGQP